MFSRHSSFSLFILVLSSPYFLGVLFPSSHYFFGRFSLLPKPFVSPLKGVRSDPRDGYEFEYVPTPLAAGGVGMYIKSDLNYAVIEKSSQDAFQALWIEVHLSNCPNIICGIMYRQHNTPERFQEYFDETLEKFFPPQINQFLLWVTST